MNPTNSFQIKRFVVGYIETNMYLIVKDREGIIIDPGFINSEAQAILKKIKAQCHGIPAVLLTHCHFDHITGCATLRREFSSRIYCHQLEREKMRDKKKNGAIFFPPEETGSIDVDRYFQDQQEISLLGLKFKIIHTPGHTQGSVSILLEGKILFSGDTIFKSSIGRTDFYDSSPEAIISSIKTKIFPLPTDTIIYPGHGLPTTVGKERRSRKIQDFIG